ncbi:MAG: D-alanyl-D-alanine carboxypeptidase family protein [Xanthomonadaceae bacterium]|nr:D-alanyl-D-alanine carboxypeptidase family protein [Xanthomonadaceae bacterium]
MNQTETSLQIRPARTSELSRLAELVHSRLPDLMKSETSTDPDHIQQRLEALLPDSALLLAIEDRSLAGMAVLDLDHARLLAIYLDPARARSETARELVVQIEQTASSFGIHRLECTVKPQAWAFMQRMGYQTSGHHADNNQPVKLSKRLLEGARPWVRQVARMHIELGIAPDYGVRHRLRMVNDCSHRVSIGPDIFSRDTELAPDAAEAWKLMQSRAFIHDIDLRLVSGFRSLAYQAQLIRKKLAEGQDMKRILKATAAPGYSEHHGGRALDITAPGVTPLNPEFGSSRAYTWLKSNAGLYGFHESYPKHNRHGLDWEPWHWCFRPRSGASLTQR